MHVLPKSPGDYTHGKVDLTQGLNHSAVGDDTELMKEESCGKDDFGKLFRFEVVIDPAL